MRTILTDLHTQNAQTHGYRQNLEDFPKNRDVSRIITDTRFTGLIYGFTYMETLAYKRNLQTSFTVDEYKMKIMHSSN